MLNFGLCDLRLVDPQCDHLSEDARARAAGAVHLLENAKVFANITDGTSDLKATFAASARLRDMNKPVISPSEMTRRIVGINASESDPNQHQANCGLIFGPERSGLTNEDIISVDALIQIESNPNFGSINLAQAVNICAYQYYAFEGTSSANSDKDDPLHLRSDDKLATKGDIEMLLSRVETVLNQPDQIQAQRRALKMRNIAGRLNITESEVRVLHGVLSSLGVGVGRHSKETER
jgi:tRNA/rRNA methyltransferase